jgi:hypothetical protein
MTMYVSLMSYGQNVAVIPGVAVTLRIRFPEGLGSNVDQHISRLQEEKLSFETICKS